MTIPTLLSDALAQLAETPVTVPAYKQALQTFTQQSAEQFAQGADVVTLVQMRAHFIDALLQHLWADHIPQDAAATLIAVGGYGRGELHPASDIDLLILVEDTAEQLEASITSFITLLWDIGLQVGHSVRSVADCVTLASTDVTVMTNLLEARYLVGQAVLFNTLCDQTQASKIWTSAEFFAAKVQEQQQRHAKADDSAYNLEPNIKLNPGGLRDIQMIGWVAKRHFAAQSLADLHSHGFLTAVEYNSLRGGERFLWRIRYALHTLTGRHEDRLLFEYQRALAEQFGYADTNVNLAVEHFMQGYYRTVIRLQRLNELLLQLFQEAIVQAGHNNPVQRINARFQARDGYLEIIDPDTFRKRPWVMLELCLVLQQNPSLQGVRANTIRAIRTHRDRMDDSARTDIRTRTLFMEILRQPAGVTHALRRMHRYGLLSRYIPAFHQITGLMQFDLFHMYTVDEHILMVLRNVRRFALAKHQAECAAYHRVWPRIAKPELLYLAALFHDIAKGRGGKHSDLGAVDAYAFCQQHDLSEQDSQLVAWLVKHHLYMSRVAQQQDIDDPDIIRAFAEKMDTAQHLHTLYLLTAADMQGTNPARWNSWKGALLERLYQSTWSMLQQQNQDLTNTQQRIKQVQRQAQQYLAQHTLSTDQITQCWATCSPDYFLQTSAEAIAWHTEHHLQHTASTTQIHFFIRQDTQRGCSEVYTFGPDRDGLFAETTAAFDQLGLNILGARIEVRQANQAISSYYVLEDDGCAISAKRSADIMQHLTHSLNHPIAGNSTPISHRPVSRRLQNFTQDTQVSFDADQTATVIALTTYDRPGLLSQVGVILDEHQLRLHHAHIMTEGSIAQDRFTCTNRHNQPITENHIMTAIECALITALDPQ